jgi:hypothetical protein
VGGCFSLPRGCTVLCFWVLGKGVACGACYSPVHSADSCKQLWSQPVGRNGATFLSAVPCREVFHWLEVQDVAEFDSD